MQARQTHEHIICIISVYLNKYTTYVGCNVHIAPKKQ